MRELEITVPAANGAPAITARLRTITEHSDDRAVQLLLYKYDRFSQVAAMFRVQLDAAKDAAAAESLVDSYTAVCEKRDNAGREIVKTQMLGAGHNETNVSDFLKAITRNERPTLFTLVEAACGIDPKAKTPPEPSTPAQT